MIFPPSGTPRHEIVDDGTKIGKVVVGEVYTIVNTGEDNNYAMRYGDWLTVRPHIAPTHDVDYYYMRKKGINYYGMAGPDGTTEYVDEKDIIIPGEEYKLLDGSTVKVVEVKGENIILNDGSIKTWKEIFRIDSTATQREKARLEALGDSGASAAPTLTAPVSTPESTSEYKVGFKYVTKKGFTCFNKSIHENRTKYYDTSKNIEIIENKIDDRKSIKDNRCLCKFKDIDGRDKNIWINIDDIILQIDKPYNVLSTSEFFRDIERTRKINVTGVKEVTVIDNDRKPYSSFVKKAILCDYGKGMVGWTNISNLIF